MVRKLSPERRERFLNAAMKLFAENGVSHTSTAAIAKEAGSAAGTLFLYFPTKQDLINELVLQITREQAANINSRLEPTLSTREAFHAIWTSTIGWFVAHMDAYLYIQQVRDSGLIPEEVAQETEKIFAFYYEVIQKGLASGSIRPYPFELVGNFLYHDTVAVVDLIRIQPDPAKQEEYIQVGFDIFWAGIKATAS